MHPPISSTMYLMWYGQDEPSDATMPGAIAAYDRFCKLDSHRPVSAAICSSSQFKPAMHAFDFIMTDPYSVGAGTNISGNLAQIGEFWTEAGLAASDGRMPVWGVPQSFTISSSAYLSQVPTPQQLRCQAYEFIAHGATGLIWYAYWTGEDYFDNPTGRDQWYIPESPLWSYFPKLNAEMNDFTQVVLRGSRVDPVRYSVKLKQLSSKCISTKIWDYKGWRYLLAVNAWNEALDARFSGAVKGRVEVMYESKSLTPIGGAFRDHFEPLAVHIYRFKPD